MKVSQVLASSQPVRMLVHGQPKTRKTRWVSGVAATHNVIWFDFDGALQILQELPQEQQDRIIYIPAYLNVDAAIKMLVIVASGKPAIWLDNNTCAVVQATAGDPNMQGTLINPNKLDASTVLVIDPWTTISHYVISKVAKEGELDTSPGSLDVDRSDYPEAFRHANNIVTYLRGMWCHVVVVAHTQEHVKVTPGTMNLPAKSQIIEFSRMIPVSVSKAHGHILAGLFNQVLYFSMKGAKTVITADGSDAITAGGSYVRGVKEFDTWPFSAFAAEAKIVPSSIANVSDFAIEGGLAELRKSVNAHVTAVSGISKTASILSKGK